LWPFGIFYGYLVYFSPFGCICSKKNLATLNAIFSQSGHPVPVFSLFLLQPVGLDMYVHMALFVVVNSSEQKHISEKKLGR
jgi:hypothetical protein